MNGIELVAVRVQWRVVYEVDEHSVSRMTGYFLINSVTLGLCQALRRPLIAKRINTAYGSCGLGLSDLYVPWTFS
jgi:hypothetical protein